jgi:predicted nucleotidyltransferase
MNNLPVAVEQCINSFVAAAQHAFGADLLSVVLYGSAADGRMRVTSDVNLLLLLRVFEPDAADALREPMRLAHAAVQMKVMFLLESELGAAADAFAVKFTDIVARHRVLYGNDPFIALDTSREAILLRLKQVLLNLQLRLRERYVLVSLREEQLVQVIADCAAPLRAGAASLRQLESSLTRPASAVSSKQALEDIVQAAGDAQMSDALQLMSSARENGQLVPGQAGPALLGLIRLTAHLRERVARLP